MKTKTFDCVEMKRQGAARIYKKTKDMTPKEEAQYWEEKNVEMLTWRNAVVRRQSISDSGAQKTHRKMWQGR